MTTVDGHIVVTFVGGSTTLKIAGASPGDAAKVLRVLADTLGAFDLSHDVQTDDANAP